MALPWTILSITAVFVTFAIMTFFGCCCSCTWFGGAQGQDDTNDHSSGTTRQPQHDHFRSINYGTHDGAPPANHDEGDAASSTNSRVSPRTRPTTSGRTGQDASSSVYSRPTDDGMDLSAQATPIESVRSSEQGSSSVEVVSGSAVKADASTTANVEMSDADLKRAMRDAVDKIKQARIMEGK